MQKFNYKKSYFKQDKQKKGTKHQRNERPDIKGVITKVNYEVCYVRIIEFVNER